MANRALQFLKLSFLIGGIADAVVAINWMLIALGKDIPNMMCGFVGTGTEYRFAMYIATLFMVGWSAILFWGWFKPYERRGLLLITAVLLFASIILEISLYQPMLSGSGFMIGLSIRAALIMKFTGSYVYSMKKGEAGEEGEYQG